MEARLTISCPDRHGIVAAVSGFLAERGANIVSSDQYSTDPEGGAFFMRMAFTIDALDAAFAAAFADEVAGRFDMRWRVGDAGRPKRVAVLVSREDHCLLDLLWRWRRGELHCEIPLVISNHPDHADDVESFGVRYEHVPVAKGEKPAAEARMLELLDGEFDLVVLARYMQILTGGFLDALGVPAINIHHSFLPAFVGAGPYAQAKERGVKLVGATAHYVTEDLDEGPIIEQDVARVSHRDTVADITRRGADVERSVLARAVAAHCADRVVVTGRTTLVF
jgi:formyltetrahydrofolate deformylase